MGAYAAMEMNAMATMLYGQRAEPWHASADIWGSACQQLLSTHGDLGAANAVIKAWPLSVGSAAHASFSGQVVGSLASLSEWAAYTGAMSAALRLGGTAIHAAQAVMPGLQSGYDTAVALSGVPIIGPFAAQAAVAIQTAGAGIMEAVGAVMQAPTAVPPPTQGWQGPGDAMASMPASPVPAVPVASVLDSTDKLLGLFDKSASLAQTMMGLAQSAGLDSAADLPSLAGESTTGAPSLGSVLTANSPVPGGVPSAVVGGAGALGAVTAMLRGARGGGEQLAASVPGARIGAGNEPALAGSTARAAAGTAKPVPAIAPPISSGSSLGGGGSTDGRAGEHRSGGRRGRTGEQEERLSRSGVQPGLQGRAAREPVEQFSPPAVRRRRGDAVLDEELFLTESDPGRRRH